MHDPCISSAKWRMPQLAGLVLCAIVAGGAFLASRHALLIRLGVGPLSLAIIFGAVLGNAVPPFLRSFFTSGVALAQTRALRLGIVLYGFNLSVQQIVEVGPLALTTDLLMICMTLVLGWIIGTRWLKLDPQTVILTSAGSAICGAAAILATEPVLGAPPHKTSAAVGSVVLFGTLGMLVYPYLYAWSGWRAPLFGIYVGATVHEVAQVVAIGKTIGEGVADTAVIVKMLRVLMLAPFLVGLELLLPNREAGTRSRVTIPWFALGFVAIVGVNSLHWWTPAEVAPVKAVDTMLLAVAMAALGFETTVQRMRQAGSGALVLGAILFVLLVVGGGALLWLMG